MAGWRGSGRGLIFQNGIYMICVDCHGPDGVRKQQTHAKETRLYIKRESSISRRFPQHSLGAHLSSIFFLGLERKKH